MIQRIFITIGVLLGLGLFSALLFLSRPTAPIPLPPVPIPAEGTQVQVQDERPAVAKSAPEYAALFHRVDLALRRYSEMHGHAYQADMSEQDGGLSARVLKPYGEGMSADDPAIFWRLLPGENRTILCAQYMNPSQALELATPISEAARTAGFLVELQACGDSAIGIWIDRAGARTAEPVEATPAGDGPQLPPLPPGTGAPGISPSMVGGGRPAVEPSPSASSATCEVNPGIDERLTRLL